MKYMPDCIIPVGGSSSRMGFWKPGLAWGKLKMLEKVVIEALSAGCRVIVAGGFRFNDVENILEKYLGMFENLLLVFSPDWSLGMDETLRPALRKIMSESFFIVPSDMPLIVSDDYRHLSELSDSMENPMVLRPIFDGKPGHPVLMHKEVSKVLLTSSAGVPVRKILEKYKTVSIPWEHDGVIRDFDNFSDYEAFKP